MQALLPTLGQIAAHAALCTHPNRTGGRHVDGPHTRVHQPVSGIEHLPCATGGIISAQPLVTGPDATIRSEGQRLHPSVAGPGDIRPPVTIEMHELPVCGDPERAIRSLDQIVHKIRRAARRRGSAPTDAVIVHQSLFTANPHRAVTGSQEGPNVIQKGVVSTGEGGPLIRSRVVAHQAAIGRKPQHISGAELDLIDGDVCQLWRREPLPTLTVRSQD